MKKDLKEIWNIDETKESVINQQLSDLINISPKKSLSITKVSIITFFIFGILTINFYFKSPNSNTTIIAKYDNNQEVDTDNLYLALDLVSDYEDFFEDDLFFMENIL